MVGGGVVNLGRGVARLHADADKPVGRVDVLAAYRGPVASKPLKIAGVDAFLRRLSAGVYCLCALLVGAIFYCELPVGLCYVPDLVERRVGYVLRLLRHGLHGVLHSCHGVRPRAPVRILANACLASDVAVVGVRH